MTPKLVRHLRWCIALFVAALACVMLVSEGAQNPRVVTFAALMLLGAAMVSPAIHALQRRSHPHP